MNQKLEVSFMKVFRKKYHWNKLKMGNALVSSRAEPKRPELSHIKYVRASATNTSTIRICGDAQN